MEISLYLVVTRRRRRTHRTALLTLPQLSPTPRRQINNGLFPQLPSFSSSSKPGWPLLPPPSRRQLLKKVDFILKKYIISANFRNNAYYLPTDHILTPYILHIRNPDCLPNFFGQNLYS